MRMDQLEYFNALTSLKTIQAVSEHFYTSPQVVSKALKQLEIELNTTLFIRTRKGIQLTESGNDVYPYVEEILNNYNHLKKEYVDKKHFETSNLHILSAKGTAFYFSPLFKSLDSNHHSVQLTFVLKIETVQFIEKTLQEENYFDLIATVCSDFELEMLSDNPSIIQKYELHILKSAPIKLFMNKNAPWSQDKLISLETIKKMPLIIYNLENSIDFDRYLKEKFHAVLNYPYQVSELSLAMDLVKENKGCFFCTENLIVNAFSPTQYKNVISKEIAVNFIEHYILLVNRTSTKNSLITMMVDLLKQNIL